MSSDVMSDINVEIYHSKDASETFKRRITRALEPELRRLGIDPSVNVISKLEVTRDGDAYVTLRASDTQE